VPGNYTIIARVQWDSIEVKDYTISINSADSIAISNIAGGKESTSLKATEDIRSSLIKDLKKAVNISDVSKEEAWAQLTILNLNVNPKSSPLARDVKAFTITPTLTNAKVPSENQWTVQICFGGGAAYVIE